MRYQPYKVTAQVKDESMVKVEISTIMETSSDNAIEKAKTILKSLKSNIDLTLFTYHAELSNQR